MELSNAMFILAHRKFLAYFCCPMTQPNVSLLLARQLSLAEKGTLELLTSKSSEGFSCILSLLGAKVD